MIYKNTFAEKSGETNGVILSKYCKLMQKLNRIITLVSRKIQFFRKTTSESRRK
jgi:hypothetical protein